MKYIADKDLPFCKILSLCETYFEQIFESDAAFNKEYLYGLEPLISTHARYSNLKAHFLTTLQKSLEEVIQSIPNLFKKRTDYSSSPSFEPTEIIFVSADRHHREKDQRKPINYDYEFSKLYRKDHVFGIDYFKKLFRNDEDVLNELNHLQQYFDEPEFYCSYNYLRQLLKKRGVLR